MIFKYFTYWSLIISYSIFLSTIYVLIPKWLFLFAACLLTTTSILGTFFINMPYFSDIEIFTSDFIIHSGPLILFLLLFNILKKKIINNYVYKYKIILLLIMVCSTYLIYIRKNIYDYDFFVLFILSLCVWIISYQIYDRLI